MSSNLTGKNILVTGADGLVGAHVVEALLPLAPAMLVAFCRDRDPRSYFYQNKFDAKCVLAYGDLKDKERVIDIVSKYEIDYIFHLAAQAIVPVAFIDPYETLASNIMGTTHILEAARLAPRVAGVVVASSDKAYGKDCHNAKEDQPLAGDHPYDVSKSCADLICQTYAKTYGLPVTVSRFGNIYGPGDLNFNRIIPGIIKAAVRNEVLPLRSDGSFKRDYVFVKDVAKGYLELAEQIGKSKGEAFNFSSGFNFSVLDLIESIGKIIGKKIEYKIVNDQRNEIPEQSLNWGKAEKLLGWKSKYSFADGIKETFEWYREFLADKTV